MLEVGTNAVGFRFLRIGWSNRLEERQRFVKAASGR
jgi:hypothetical protein